VLGTHVLESRIPSIVIQGIGSPPGHEEIGVAVVVAIAYRHAVAEALGHAADSRGSGHVFERPVAAVAEQSVSPGGLSGIGGEPASLDEIDIEPAVAIVVDEADAPFGEFGELVHTRVPVIVDKQQAGGLAIIAEPGRDRIDSLGTGRRAARLRGKVGGEELSEGLPRRAPPGFVALEACQGCPGAVVVGHALCDPCQEADGFKPAPEGLGQPSELGRIVGEAIPVVRGLRVSVSSWGLSSRGLGDVVRHLKRGVLADIHGFG
jgi:hypothetical protein